MGWVKDQLGDLYGKVIDFHVHDENHEPLPSTGKEVDMVRLARYYGIGKIVHLGNVNGILRGNRAGTDNVAAMNDYTLELMKRYPDIIVGFCYLNPMHVDSFCLDQIERCIVEGGMKGIKLWTPCNARRQRIDPIAARAGQLGVPIVFHTWYKTNGLAPEESSPADVADMGRRHPNTTIVLAHMGGGREHGILDLVDVPNLCYDTSGSQPEADLVEYAVRRLGPERVLYASDWPVRDFGVQISRILGAALTEEQRYKVLCGNARRLLGMEDN